VLCGGGGGGGYSFACGKLCNDVIDLLVVYQIEMLLFWFGACSYIICHPMQVLGTPTREEIKCMNPNYTEFKFPQIKAHPWHKVYYMGMCLHFL